jgi:hypothetical protein
MRFRLILFGALAMVLGHSNILFGALEQKAKGLHRYLGGIDFDERQD